MISLFKLKEYLCYIAFSCRLTVIIANKDIINSRPSRRAPIKLTIISNLST